VSAPTRTRRAVLTGLGVVAPNGLGTDDWWAATLAGTHGIGEITRFDAGSYPSRLAGEVPGFDAREHVPGRLLAQTDHMTRLALTAATWAIRDAGVRPEDLPEFSAGVVTASASGGFEFGQRELQALWRDGPDHVSAYQSFAWFYAVNTGQISIANGLRGPSGVIVTEQAGGLDALAIARRHIRRGAGLMVSGGVDASLCPWGWTAQLTTGRISEVPDPERAYLPFSPAATGYVPGEGGAILVVEEESAARERGAGIYAEVAGYAATFDPAPDRGRPSTLRRAMELALADAGLAPEHIGVVFADGAGTPEGDRAESAALAEVFGPFGVPVTVPKTMTGRLYSGGAALDVAAAAKCLQTGVIPPTAHVAVPAAEHLIDLVVEPREFPIDAALVVSRGLGGFNSAMVLCRAGHLSEEPT
jgi:act minimal PKS chain-length factor (CLF/KS beta)